MFVKFCGFTRPLDVEAACSLGVSACGFIFYSGSKRFCNFEKAKDCISICKNYGVMSVGVFVDSSLNAIISISDTLNLDAVQIYAEDLYIELSQKYLTILGIRVGKNFSTKLVPSIKENDFYLFDTLDSSLPGGTGKQFNWELIKDFPYLEKTIIAGGINSNNIKTLLSMINPFGVDISSGIEDSPGIKNISKMQHIVHTIKELGYDISR